MSPFTVPPAPHCDFNSVTSRARSLPSAFNPRITVTIFPCRRFSRERCAVCEAGGMRSTSAGVEGQVQSASSSPHWQHLGGWSNGVPAKSRIGSSSRSAGVRLWRVNWQSAGHLRSARPPVVPVGVSVTAHFGARSVACDQDSEGPNSTGNDSP
jgi:hypothetical protein